MPRRTHAGIIVQVNFNVAADDATKRAHEVIYLSRVRASDGVSNTNTIHTDLVDSLID